MSVDIDAEGFELLDIVLSNGSMNFGIVYAGRNAETEIARFFEWCRANPTATVQSDHGDYPVQTLLDRYIDDEQYSSISVGDVEATLRSYGRIP